VEDAEQESCCPEKSNKADTKKEKEKKNRKTKNSKQYSK
jgi:hypothetical protein